MILYHGTCLKNWNSIQNDGFIKPRGNSAGNWFTNEGGCPNLVYLKRNTDDRIRWFSAFKAALANDDTIMVELGIDTSKLDQDKMRPDEYYVAHVNTGKVHSINKTEIIKFKNMVEDSANLWKDSLESINLCSYCGEIPVEAIVSIETKDIKECFYYKSAFFRYESIEARNILFDAVLYTANNTVIPDDGRPLVDKHIDNWQRIHIPPDYKPERAYHG